MLDLLWDEEVNYLFTSFDPRCLRSAFSAVQWAPPPSLAETVPASQDDDQTWEKVIPTSSFVRSVPFQMGLVVGRVSARAQHW